MALANAHSSATHRTAVAAGPLASIIAGVAAGRFPPPDGTVTIVPQPSGRDAGVISFTAHSVVFADTDPGWIAAQLPPDDLAAPLSAQFLHALGQRLGRRSHSVDMLTCAPALPGPPPAALALSELAEEPNRAHPRIARALHYRDAVRVWQTAGGIVTIGRGVAGRWETSIEVDPAHRGRGLGASLATAARHLAPAGAALWAQIAPANAASVRAFLAAGFRPVGAEALLSRAARREDSTMTDESGEAVTDNRAESRLEVHTDGELAELTYRTRAGRLILIHAGVPDALGGRGVGGRLVRAAIDKAAADGMTLVPLCPFARGWLERHSQDAGRVPIDWTAPDGARK